MPDRAAPRAIRFPDEVMSALVSNHRNGSAGRKRINPLPGRQFPRQVPTMALAA